MTDARTRHNRGLLVVILLAVVFFALLAAIVLTPPRRDVDRPAPEEKLTVLAPRVRLRTEPTAKAPVIANAAQGDVVTLVEDRGAWVRVATGDGTLSGWVERNLLERTNERTQRLARYAAIRKLPPLAGRVTQRTPLYAGPGIFYPMVGELPGDTQVHIFTRDHDFYAIDYQNVVAYADVDAIDVTAAGTKQFDVATSSAAPTTTDTTATTSTEPPQTASAEPPPPAEPEEPPAQSAAPSVPEFDGVYPAVPPGGTQPVEVDRVIPRYPALARARGVGGAVVIRGIVRRDGSIDDVEVIKDLPYGLGEAARDAVEQWKFRPATFHGEAIDVYYTVTVNFRLQ